MQSDNSRPADNGHYIVAIGASAGGLEAIHDFFDNMPPVGNLSFVIVQHLSPDYKSLLVELIAKHTHMQVLEAVHDALVLPACVYVIPNDKLLTIRDGRLQLGNKSVEKAPNTAIDTFFKSLAEDQGGKSIAIVLSGTGTDGSRGIAAIHERDGLVIVQDPLTAKFDGMPNSAIATGVGDFILAPELMPDELFTYIAERPERIAKEGKPDESSLPEVLELIKHNCGHDFHNYKTATILRRISKRMGLLGYTHFKEYIAYLRSSPEECTFLGKEFLIGVTKFFRDTAAFEILRKDVLLPLIHARSAGDTLKVWVTACSTGEEAYSIAILVDELLQQQGKELEVKVFASDIDGDAIETASRGIYSSASIIELGDERAAKYFSRDGSGYLVNPRIRKQIVFARHNVLKDPPFIKNDLVTCRNMLIYMNSMLQAKVLATLQFSLNTGGALFLGPSEVPLTSKDGFADINNKWKIFKKISDTNRYKAEIFPSVQEHRAERAAKTMSPKGGEAVTDLGEEFKAVLTEKFGFTAVYIDRNFDIKDAVGDFRRYLSLPDKIVALNILKMVEQELALALNAAVRKCLKEGKEVSLNHVRLRGAEEKSVNLFVRPSTREGLVMIIMGEVANFSPSRSTVEKLHSDSPEHLQAVLELEEELKETRFNLQMAVESVETANEELQSSNEELLSSNEELQSSNEELQSLNEELHTLNTEHQLRIKELLELNEDLDNYFRSTEIAQLFIDGDLRIRKFNPVAVKMINVIEGDIGRPLAHISTNLEYKEIIADLQTVISTQKVIEKEVVMTNGTVNLMRILPYLRMDKKVDGAVITFIDVTNLKELNTIIKTVFNATLAAVMAFKSVRDSKSAIVDFEFTAANESADKLIQMKGGQYAGKSLKEVFPQLLKKGFFEKCTRVTDSGTPMHFEMQLEYKETTGWYDVIITQLLDGVVVSLTSINEKKKAEEKFRNNYQELLKTKESYRSLNLALETKIRERTFELTQSEERFRLISNATSDAIWDRDIVNDGIWWSESFYKWFGYEETEETRSGRFWKALIHPEDLKKAEAAFNTSIQEGSDLHIEYRLRNKGGQYIPVLDRGKVLNDEHGISYRLVGAITDLSFKEIKYQNEVLKASNTELEDLTATLLKTNEELEESNSELYQFASIASHDLKEPVRKIAIFSSLLKNRYGNELSADAHSYIDKILTSTSRMGNLIHDLLSFTKLSVSNSFEKVDLNVILGEVLTDLELLIEDKKAIIEVGDLPQADIIPGHMRQVFQNIISNALKFSKAGEQPQIKIRSVLVGEANFHSAPDEEGRYCKITIEDRGIGFDNDYAEKIFTIFQRLHTREQYDGTGIGLAIARKVITRHHGKIMAEGR
ncbi:MAG TPA: chemotaxis protein CheB, partial [Flavisolibacter sp.]